MLLALWIVPEKFASTAKIIPAPTMTDPIQIAREMETIRSKPILGTVVTNLSLNKKWSQKLKTDDFPTDLSILTLFMQVELEQTRKNGIISVRVTSDDRNEAAIIANEIAAVYRDQTKGSDGKPAAQIIDQAEPALRPLRGYQIWPLAIMVVLALIALATGIFLLRKAGRQPIPPIIPDGLGTTRVIEGNDSVTKDNA